MKPWEDKGVRKNDWVRDLAGVFGTGRATCVWPYGCDIQWEDGHVSFLGFGWLEKAISPQVRAEYNSSLEFTIADDGSFEILG